MGAECQIRIGIGRAGNVIGGGDWAKDRIVPDCMRAWAGSKSVEVRRPSATRPWQHVLEPLSGYLRLAQVLASGSDFHGEAYNFGPVANQNHTVQELIEAMQVLWEKVQWRDTSDDQTHAHEAGLLKLNCDKALADLQWMPTLGFGETVEMTVEWYRKYHEAAEDIAGLTVGQIGDYEKLALQRCAAWATEN